jgi:energy-coupling factor transport system substrate-specific component
MVVVGAAAFLYPFWLPARALPDRAHGTDAPLVAAVVGAMVVAAIVLELRRGTINGATVALLGVLSAMAGLLRLLDLPGGGSGIFFLVVLAGAAFGGRFGMLLGLCGMATSAVNTGGVGPWLPFQMLTLGWMGGGAGLVGTITRRWPRRAEVIALAVYGWLAGFAFGAVMNLWFWPFASYGPETSFVAGDSVVANAHRYAVFYVTTSLPWDLGRSTLSALVVLLAGAALLRALRRASRRAAFDAAPVFDEASP